MLLTVKRPLEEKQKNNGELPGKESLQKSPVALGGY